MDLVNKSENTSSVIVKTKILGLKEELNKYKDLCEASKRNLENEKQRKAETEREVEHLRRSVKALEEQCLDINKKVLEATDKLTLVTKETDDCERSRRALDHRKNVDSDRIAALEQMLKETRILLHDSERKCEEVSRKLQTTENEEERATTRTDLAETKTKALQIEMKALTAKLKSCQLELEEFGLREEKYEQTVSHLSAQLKNAQLRNEKADAAISKLQDNIKFLQNELTQFRTRHAANKA